MAVQYVKENNNFLGALGGLATLGGMLTGQPWLSALGTGLGAANSIMNGNATQGDVQSLGDILKNIISWKNPASGNIAKVTNPVVNAIGNVAGQVTNTNPYMTSLGLQHKLKGFSNGGF